MPVNPCCCGCAACDSGATGGVSYLATFPGTFGLDDGACPTGFQTNSGDSQTTYTMNPISTTQCEHGNDGLGGGELIIDGKNVSSITFFWGNLINDPEGTCPRWIFQIIFNDSDGEVDGPTFQYEGGSDPRDPTGTYTLGCAECEENDPCIGSGYTAPDAVTIS